MSLRPPPWFPLTYLNHYWMGCGKKFWHRHSNGSQRIHSALTDNLLTFLLAPPAGQIFHLSSETFTHIFAQAFITPGGWVLMTPLSFPLPSPSGVCLRWHLGYPFLYCGIIVRSNSNSPSTLVQDQIFAKLMTSSFPQLYTVFSAYEQMFAC